MRYSLKDWITHAGTAGVVFEGNSSDDGGPPCDSSKVFSDVLLVLALALGRRVVIVWSALGWMVDG